MWPLKTPRRHKKVPRIKGINGTALALVKKHADHFYWFFLSAYLCRWGFFFCLSFPGHRARHELYQQGSHLQQLWVDAGGRVSPPSIWSSLAPCPGLMPAPCCHNDLDSLSHPLKPAPCLPSDFVMWFPPGPLLLSGLIHFSSWTIAPELGRAPLALHLLRSQLHPLRAASCSLAALQPPEWSLYVTTDTG